MRIFLIEVMKGKVIRRNCPLEGTLGVLRGCFTQSFTEFFEVDCVEERYTEALRFFLFQVSGFRFVAQSLTKFYIELHGAFFEVDCVELDARRRFAFWRVGDEESWIIAALCLALRVACLAGDSSASSE